MNLWKKIADWPRWKKVALFLVVYGVIGNLFFHHDKTAGVTPAVNPTETVETKTWREAYTGSDPKTVLLRDVTLHFSWSKNDMNIMIANFTLHNPTPFSFKDFEITCTHSAPSGTVIDSNTRTLYELIRPNSTRSFKDFNMGFINSQAESSSCKIADLVVLN